MSTIATNAASFMPQPVKPAEKINNNAWLNKQLTPAVMFEQTIIYSNIERIKINDNYKEHKYLAKQNCKNTADDARTW